MSPTVCAEPGCPELTPCPAHHKPDRGSRGGSTYAWRQKRAAVIARDKGICWLCNKPGADSADHVNPRSRGGSDDMTNLKAAHLSCNLRRGTRSIGDR